MFLSHCMPIQYVCAVHVHHHAFAFPGDICAWQLCGQCVYLVCVFERDMGGMLLGTQPPPPSLPGWLKIDGGGVASAHSSITHFIWVLEERKGKKD